jgi:hypothetical protein
MGIEVYRDMEELLAAAKLDHQRILVIPNGSVVIPRVEAGAI